MASAGRTAALLLALVISASACAVAGGADEAVAPSVTLAPPSTSPPSTEAPAADTTEAHELTDPGDTGATPDPQAAAPPSGEPEAIAAAGAAVDALLAAPHLDFRSTMDSTNELFGRFAIITEGTWSVESPTSELRIGFLLDEQAEAALGTTVSLDPNAELEFDDVTDLLHEGFVYRFIDDEVWQLVDGEWLGTEAGFSSTDAALAAATDVGAVVSHLFANPAHTVEWSAAGLDAAGRATYRAPMDADTIIPLLGPSAAMQNLFDAGWDGVTGLRVEVMATVDDQGRLMRFALDQTEWYRAGWEALGQGDLAGDKAAVTLAYDIEYPARATVHEVPCDDPVRPADADEGLLGTC